MLTGQLVIRSRLAPPVTITIPGTGGTGAPSALGALVAAAKPAVDVTLNGVSLGTYAPGGDPGTTNYGLATALVLAAVVGLAVFGAVTLLKR